jgi:hypothetical protein
MAWVYLIAAIIMSASAWFVGGILFYEENNSELTIWQKHWGYFGLTVAICVAVGLVIAAIASL